MVLAHTKKAFTLVELVVTVSIIVILAGIGFVSYGDSIISARDSRRVNDIESLRIGLKSQKLKEGSYPLPVSPFTLMNSGIVAYQGVIGDTILSNVLNNIPKDPKSNNWYSYSVKANKQKFQLALTKENQGSPIALISGDYKSLAKNLFPTLLIAYNGSTSIDLSETSINRKYFILNNGSYNIPYDMNGSVVANGVSFEQITSESGVTIEKGGNYFSCNEIYQAGMDMGSGTYQIVSNTGILIDTGCLMNY